MERSSLGARMLGAARLDRGTWRRAPGDRGARRQALFAVALVAVAEAIAVAGAGPVFAIGAFLTTFLGWLFWAASASLLAPRREGRGGKGVGTALGFAQSPRLLALLGLPFQLDWALSLVLAPWILLTATVALRVTLGTGAGRAFLGALPGWAVVVFLRSMFAW